MRSRRYVALLISLAVLLMPASAAAHKVKNGAHGKWHFSNPNHTNKPCQMVQLKRQVGWSPPFTPPEARARFHGRDGVKHRTVPWDKTFIYQQKHGWFLVNCIAHKWWSVPGGASKAHSVAECESHYFPHAVSPTGEYLGVYQMGPGRFHDWKPSGGKSHIFNSWANIWAALHNVYVGGWSPWACA